MRHPLALPGNETGAKGMRAGARVTHIDGRSGVADEFLPDGGAYVTFDDGFWEIVNWANLKPEEPSP